MIFNQLQWSHPLTATKNAIVNARAYTEIWGGADSVESTPKGFQSTIQISPFLKFKFLNFTLLSQKENSATVNSIIQTSLYDKTLKYI